MAARSYNGSMQNTIAKINLAAIKSNAQHLKTLSKGAQLFAVVKADAYGHGAIPVARALSPVADMFCVAIVDEGVELRAAGISSPILVFTPPMDGDDAARMSAYGLTATVADERSARLCRGLCVHIKINTGMNRYGCPPPQLEQLLNMLGGCCVQGVYSHIYAPQSPKDCAEQLKAFSHCAAIVRAKYPQTIAHLAATAGIYLGEDYFFDAVRPGIGLYGYTPQGFEDNCLTPALAVYARRVQTFTPPYGGGCGYMQAQKDYQTLSSYRAGYADGFARTSPLGEGNLCMDAFVSKDSEEEVCIFSDAETYAAGCNTISYEALCAVTKRSLRVYEG